MTLILSLLTHAFTVQVSDRRLTRLDGSLFEDNENKAQFFCGQSAFAYTGLARLGTVNTDEWLLETLGPSRSLGEGIETVRR